MRSLIGNRREIWASFWKSMGPLIAFLAILPKVPAATGFVQGLAVVVEPQKALRLSQALVATEAAAWPPCRVTPVFCFTPGTTLGRSLPVLVSEMSCPLVTLIGAPLVMCSRGAISQSLTTHFAMPWSGNFVV